MKRMKNFIGILSVALLLCSCGTSGEVAAKNKVKSDVTITHCSYDVANVQLAENVSVLTIQALPYFATFEAVLLPSPEKPEAISVLRYRRITGRDHLCSRSENAIRAYNSKSNTFGFLRKHYRPDKSNLT